MTVATSHRTKTAKERALTAGHGYTQEQGERLGKIHARMVEARRELDALIGDAYLRPRASIVPVHFLDLASAAEKLRWAEKEWRELDKEMADARSGSPEADAAAGEDDDAEEEDLDSDARGRIPARAPR